MKRRPNLEDVERERKKAVSTEDANTESSSTPEDSTSERKPLEPVDNPPQIWNVNPLEIDHILENVLKYLVGPATKCPNTDSALREDSRAAFHDLCNVRLVSTRWRDASTQLFLQGRAPITFGKLDAAHTNYAAELETFLHTMQASSMIPVQRYSLDVHLFREENRQLLNNFFLICGPTAVEIKLTFCSSIGTRFTKRDFPSLKMEKLQKLTFAPQTFCYETGTYPVPWLVGNLLQAAPKLQDFRLVVPNNGLMKMTGNKDCRQLDEVVCKHLPETVKILRVDVPLTENQLVTLTGRNLKLHEFHVDIQFVVGTEAFRNFLLQQASCLKVLNIHDGTVGERTPIEFPCLQELSDFKILNGFIKPFSYPTTFPKLIILQLVGCCKEQVTETMMAPGNVSITVEEISFARFLPLLPQVTKAHQCFPNLKRVSIFRPAFEEVAAALPDIFLHYIQLEELHISILFGGNRNADSVFSGISEEGYKRVARKRNWNAVNEDDMRNAPSILNLTNLKKLAVHGLQGNANFTDFAVRFIFLKLENLKELDVSRFEMSTNHLIMLKEKVALTFIDQNKNYRSHFSF